MKFNDRASNLDDFFIKEKVMQPKRLGKKQVTRIKDSAIIIDNEDEQFIIISSQTALSSCNKMVISKNLNDTATGSIRRAGFNISLGDNTEIERRTHFDGFQLIARETNISFNYKSKSGEQYDISGLQFPAPSVAAFIGGYSSRDGCFIVSLSNKQQRIIVVAGVLDRGNTRLTAFGFPTTIAKPTHNICTTYPEIMPRKYLEIINEYGEVQEEGIFNQVNDPFGSSIRIEVQPQIFEDLNIDNKAGTFVVVRFELPKAPTGECIQSVLAVI